VTGHVLDYICRINTLKVKYLDIKSHEISVVK
jgi:hypothetical protein